MKYHLAFIFGLILLVIPFFGIPTAWKFTIIEVMGVVLMILATMRHYHKDSINEENQTFSDSEDDLEELGMEDIQLDNEIYEEEEKDDY